MDWLRENWFWVGIAGLFLWSHMRMHGAHGHSGGCGGHGRSADRPSPADPDREEHRHAQH